MLTGNRASDHATCVALYRYEIRRMAAAKAEGNGAMIELSCRAAARYWLMAQALA